MPLRCSCGAILPEDARFCHKCGAPQYEEDIARMNAVEAPPPAAAAVPAPAQPTVPSRVGFSNGRAVRITLAVAALSFLASSIIGSFAPPIILFPIVLAAGFTSARVYRSLTSEILTASGGAILGAMTGLWLYLPAAISAGFSYFFTTQGKEMLVKALKNAQTAQLIDDPTKLVPVLILALILFVFIGAASGALGGILAVRWQPRNTPSH